MCSLAATWRRELMALSKLLSEWYGVPHRNCCACPHPLAHMLQAEMDFSSQDMHAAIEIASMALCIPDETDTQKATGGSPATSGDAGVQGLLGTASADALLQLNQRQMHMMSAQLASWDALHTAVGGAHSDVQALQAQLGGTHSSTQGFMAQAAQLAAQRTCMLET